MQIPTVICLVIMGNQAVKLLGSQEFIYINWGWGLNLAYLLISIVFSISNRNNTTLNVLEILFNGGSIYCFYLAVFKSKKKRQLWLIKYGPQRNILPLFVLALALAIWAIFTDVVWFRLPMDVLDFAVIFLLAKFFKSFREQYKESKFIYGALGLYSFIQFLDLVPSKTVIPIPELNLIITANNFGFAIGLICKLVILVGLSYLLLNSVKDIFKIEQELLLKEAFGEKLKTIIGRTFHEVTPPLLEAETLVNDLQDEDVRNSDIMINRRGRKEIEKMDNAIQRVRTILTASQKMYYSDELNLSPWEDDNKIIMPVDSETDIHNVNTLIEVAMMNIKAIVLADYKDNSGVSNRVKFHAEFGGKCNVFCNSVEMVQIIYNLFKNSYEATEDLSACNIYIKTKNIVTYTDEKINSKLVVIEIEDDGPGIPLKIQEDIFKQGFSTKIDKGRGRGFGLDIVKAYAENYGGTVKVESPVQNSRPQHLNNQPGTKFILSFPKS
jgi:signal transduction histidine kinase